MSAAGEGLTEPNHNFLSLLRKKMQTSQVTSSKKLPTPQGLGVFCKLGQGRDNGTLQDQCWRVIFKKGDKMKLKRNALIILILGVVMSVVGLIAPLISLNFASESGATGIIGGADAPTYKFLLFNLLDGLLFVVFLLGISLILSSAFCLLFSKTVKKHCNISTSALSVGLSSVGALGLVCALVWFAMVAFNEASKHPIQYPVSVTLGVLCFFAFISLIVVYFYKRSRNWSVIGIVVDILTSIVYLPAFFFAFTYLYELIG